MTPEERALIERVADRVDQMNRALFEVPEGSPKDERPLIEGLRIMWRAYQRGSWLARVFIWVIPTVAGVIAGWDSIKEWLAEWLR